MLIPEVNDEHILDIAYEVKRRGASLMNILPLIPLNKFKGHKFPTCDDVSKVRDEVEQIIPVFRACTLCRADAFGIPGKHEQDFSLGVTPRSHY